MAKIINPGNSTITLPTLHVVPRRGEIETTNQVIRDNGAMLVGLALSGQITVEMDPETDGEGDVVAPPVIEPTPAAKAQAEVSAMLAAAAAETEAAMKAAETPTKTARASKAETQL